jgi:hypothetical protein
MRTKYLRLVCAITVALSSSNVRAQSDFSLNPNENVQVVYAVYGGNTYDKTLSHYVTVTDKVSDLLKSSPDGFPVAEKALTGKETTDLVQSLIIVYNYNQNSFFYNAPAGGSVSLDTLKTWAKAHRKVALIGNPIDTSPGGDFHVVFAAYGVGDNFINATDPVKKLIHDQPDGFIPTEDAMGGDPHPSWAKLLVVIFDDGSQRHLYTMFNIGPKVTKDALLEAEKSN